MSMTETTEPVATPKKAPAKKRRARPIRRAAPPPAAKVSEMAGITPTDCPMACNATRCVISGQPVCAHPHKAGLQIAMQNEVTLRRFNEAKRTLGKAKLDLQNP
jgi:hypothetical protein